MDLIGFLKVLLKRKWLILGVSVFAAVATFLIAIRTSKVYLSKAQLELSGVSAPRIDIVCG